MHPRYTNVVVFLYFQLAKMARISINTGTQMNNEYVRPMHYIECKEHIHVGNLQKKKQCSVIC